MSLRNAVALSISPYRNAHELWTKLKDNYGVSIDSENDCSPSTTGRNELSTSSTSPTCGKPQNNAMVSRDKFVILIPRTKWDRVVSILIFFQKL